MKKILIYASMFGFATGVICWLCKKGKRSSPISMHTDRKETSVHNNQEEPAQSADIVEQLHQTKSWSAQNVSARHSEAGEIMQKAYQNIMEDFIEDLPGREDIIETNAPIIDSKSVSIMKEIDSISDELDDLLK